MGDVSDHKAKKSGSAEARWLPASAPSVVLQRAKEVQHVLFLRRAQRTKVVDQAVRLRLRATCEQTAEEATVRGVCSNGLQKVGSAAVVQEKQPLSQTPKRRRAEPARTGRALRDSIGQPRAHVMHSNVGKEISCLVAQSRRGRSACHQSWRMTQGATRRNE